MATPTIRLGVVDADALPPDPRAYFGAIHEPAMIANAGLRFRDEKKSAWTPFTPVAQHPVAALQQFLKAAGFFPFGKIDGICGYRTTAAIRLFQEYVRSVEQDATIGVPDGIYGPNTDRHVQRWKQDGRTADWKGASSQQPQPEYRVWMGLLHAARDAYRARPTDLLKKIAAFPHPSDTAAVAQWDFDPARIHLVGIRRNESAPLNPDGRRATDDVFVLLINGLVFKFFGTTDPGTSTNAAGAPFLVHGQHAYRFGWHKQADRDIVYQALKPLSTGVLVVRDRSRDLVLSQQEHFGGALERNDSINIHWGGRGGTANWSAGCQVICGRAYINHHDATVDCAPFAAAGYSALGTRVGGLYQTKGAYSVLADLVTAFSGDVHAVSYTLLYEPDLERSPQVGAAKAAAILDRLL